MRVLAGWHPTPVARLQPPHRVVCVCVKGPLAEVIVLFIFHSLQPEPCKVLKHKIIILWEITEDKKKQELCYTNKQTRMSFILWTRHTADSLCFELYEVGVHRDICLWHSCGGQGLEKFRQWKKLVPKLNQNYTYTVKTHYSCWKKCA